MVRWIVDTATTPGTWEEYANVYASLELAQADAYDLVTATESLTIDCTSGADSNADTTAVTVDGWTTSVDYTLTIQAHKNDQHGGVWSDLIYRLHPATSGEILSITQNLSVNYLQVELDAAIDTQTFGVYTHSAAELSNLLVKFTGSYAYATGIRNSSTANLSNCTLSGLTDIGIYISNYDSLAAAIDNCVTYDCHEGISRGGSADVSMTSCISLGCSLSDFSGTFNESSDHNVSSDTTAPGTNVVHDFDHSTLFPNAASGDFRPAISYVSAFGTTWGAGAIPWERSVEVNTDTGGDYTSLATAEAGEQTIGDDLVLRNEKIIISCTSGGTTTADTTAVTIDANWTTSESCDFTVQAHENDKHGGKWDENKYYYNASAKIEVAAHYVTTRYLQIKSTDTLYGMFNWIGEAGVCLGCFMSGDLVATWGIYSQNTSATAPMIIRNCIFVDLERAAVSTPSTSNLCMLVTNCVGINLNGSNYDHAGFERAQQSGSLSIINTIGTVSDNCTWDVFVHDGVTLHSSSATNISSDGTAPDNSISYTVYDAAVDTLPVVPENCVIFKDIVNNDFRLVSHKVENYKGEMVETNSAIGNGTYLYDVEDDCAGKSRQPYQFKGTRTQRDFDIGAWQAPVQLTYVVDTDGVSGDYSSLATGFAGLQADTTDLVTDNMLPTISCQASTGVADTTTVNNLGTVTDQDNFFIIIGTDDYVLDVSNYHAFYCRACTKFDSMQIRTTSTSSYHHALYVNDDTDALHVEITDSTLTASTNNSNSIFNNSSASLVLNNVICFTPDTATGNTIQLESSSTTVINNSTLRSVARGIRRINGTVLVSNTVSIGAVSGDFSGILTLTNCVSSDSTGDITGLSSTYFTDPANGDFTPVASAGQLTAYSASANATETVGAIPFVDEKAVDTGGTGDYTSLATWEAAAQNFCVAGETIKAILQNTNAGRLSSVIFDGLAAGVDVHIAADDPYKHEYDLDDSATHVKIVNISTGTHVLQLNSSNNYTLEGLDINQRSGGTSDECVRINADDVSLVINDCLLWFPSRVAEQDCIYINSQADSNITCKNTIFANAYRAAIDLYENKAGSLNNIVLRTCCFDNIGYSNDQSSRSGIVGDYSVYDSELNVAIIDCTITLDTTDRHVFTTTADVDPHYKVIITNCVFNTTDVNYPTEPSLVVHCSDNVVAQDFTGDFVSATDLHTTDSPYELWGADGAYAGAFGDEPYEVVRAVDTDGVSGDESNLQAALNWFKNNRSDLVTRNEKTLITCAASTSVADTQVDFEDIITSNKHSVTLLGDGFDGDYVINGASYYTILPRIKNIIIRDMQIHNNSTASACIYCYGIEDTELLVEDCIIICNSESTCIALSWGFQKLRNCVLISTNPNNYANIDLHNALGVSVENCTCYGDAPYPFHNSNSHYAYIANSYFSGNGTGADMYCPNNFHGSNNMTSDGSALGVDSLTNQVATDIFTNPAAGDFTLKEGSNAIGAGVDLSEYFTDDITGAAREVPWDIGAFKYVTASGTVVTFTADTLAAIHNAAAYTADTKSAISELIEQLYDTSTSITTNKISTADTFTKVLNNKVFNADSAASISNILDLIFDSKAAISNTEVATADTTNKITTNKISTADTTAAISTDLTKLADLRSKIHNNTTLTYDSIAKISTIIDNIFDTNSSITNDIVVDFDTVTSIINAVEYNFDTKSAISNGRINTFDTNSSIVNDIVATFDTKTVIKNQHSVIVDFDTLAKISNTLVKDADLKAEVSNERITSADVKAAISNIEVIFADSESKISNTSISLADLKSGISNETAYTADTLTVISASIHLVEAFDSKVRIQNSISNNYDTRVTIVIEEFEDGEMIILRLEYAKPEMTTDDIKVESTLQEHCSMTAEMIKTVTEFSQK